MKKLIIFALLIFTIACSNEPVEVRFIDINNALARFDIVNNSNKDVEKIIFEVSYLDKSNKIIFIDTLSYQMSTYQNPENTPLLKANDNTFIILKTPENCQSTDISILKVYYIENE